MKARYRFLDEDGSKYLQIYNQEDTDLGIEYAIMSFHLHPNVLKIYHWSYVPWSSRGGAIVWMRKPQDDTRDWALSTHWVQSVTGIYRGYEQPVEDLELERSVLLLFDADPDGSWGPYVPDECKGTLPMELDEFIRRLEDIGIRREE
jgi:hypothetical protein